MEWYLKVLKQYAVFSGRARRKEYWMFTLFNLLIAFAISFIEIMLGGYGTIGSLYILAVLIPAIAVSVRRLHDIDRSGWWLLIGLIPFGSIVLFVFFVLDSKVESNEYGPNPKLAAD
ncbi:DUF805 domain-containing protein [Endozoicomonas euniceicola]|uniref:DUF805 domain-containing protein n=1 Tax=Endozoicomonas euniceicola TaxID=1234143 RepID=A0ABY6GWE3_9GAMM|nr:DUF805 domain-containing protein [Endozoicomonas euniceicola]UYM17088.1 DUF805 domain-containing protein [Endozoicomonas euniceicola]